MCLSNDWVGEEAFLKTQTVYDLQKRIGNFEYVAQLDGTFTPPYSFANWLKEAAKKRVSNRLSFTRYDILMLHF